METTFNMGVGMVVVLTADAADAGMSLLDRRGVPAWVCGTVAPAGSGTRDHVSLFGTHPRSEQGPSAPVAPSVTRFPRRRGNLTLYPGCNLRTASDSHAAWESDRGAASGRSVEATL